MVVTRHLLILTVLAVVVECRPQQDLVFPEESESGSSSSSEDRIPQNPFSGRPNGNRPQRPNQQFSQNGFNQRPNNMRPVGNNPSLQNGRPGQFPSGNGNNPSSSQNGRPVQSNSGNENGNSQRGTTQRRPTATQSTTPASGTSGSTLPPRDPTNRIVYTFSCQQNPPCQHTSQYSPVCGTDGQTYGNIGILFCEQQCPNKSVEKYMDGACPRSG